MYSASTYDVMKSYLTEKFVMSILHWKQGLLCDKTVYTNLKRKETYNNEFCFTNK